MATAKKYAQLAEEYLAAIRFDGRPEELYGSLRYVMGLCGKRTRPVLVLSACELFGGKAEAALPAAAAIELFHNFTLVHDDIMDKAPLRRNSATVHEKWNANTAILCGDALMVSAYSELMKSPASCLAQVLEVFNAAALKVCEGQQLDMNYEHAPAVSISAYLEMIRLKTAVLLGASLHIGALVGGARQEDAQRMYRFGENLGIAFQLQDDLLDAYGDEKRTGKQKGGDILSGKKTFLILKALEISAPYQKEELLNWMQAPASAGDQKVEAVIGIFDQLKIKELAEKEMKACYARATDSLKEIPIPEASKKELFEFVEALSSRQH